MTNPHRYPVFCLHFFSGFSPVNRIQQILRALWRELNSQGMVRSCESGGVSTGADVQGLMCVIDAWNSLSAALLFLVGCFLNPHSVVFSLTAFPFSFSTLSPLCSSYFVLPHSLRVSPMPLTSHVIINSGISIFACSDKFLLPSEELN